MQVTNGRLVGLVGLVGLGMLTVAAGLLIPAKFPAAKGVITVVVVCGLVCYLAIALFNLYRRYKVLDKTTLHITTGIGACAVGAVLMEASKVVLLTLLCVTIANGAANVLYAVHLKREEGCL